MRSRFMINLTSPEVQEYLSSGGETAILPVGSVEMHGPHMPLCTDTLISKAFAVRLAEKTNGLVMPELNYTWAGSTDGFAGTISVDPELVMKVTEAVADQIFKTGFKRLILLTNHNTNNCPLFIFARRYFEKYLRPVVSYYPYDRLFASPADRARFFGDGYMKGWECSILLGACKILNVNDVPTLEEMAYEDEAPPYEKTYKDISRIATVGYFMQDLRQHICPAEKISAEVGINYIEACTDELAVAVNGMSNYEEYIKTQENKGRQTL